MEVVNNRKWKCNLYRYYFLLNPAQLNKELYYENNINLKYKKYL